ncbi:hypothetical protein, partial [Pseudorhodobacter sp.]|uniref:hypothetical protein n=1 Tax=Pseudorhodobacter sp. TaxID=1934400 RepID=UPI002AFF91E0
TRLLSIFSAFHFANKEHQRQRRKGTNFDDLFRKLCAFSPYRPFACRARILRENARGAVKAVCQPIDRHFRQFKGLICDNLDLYRAAL